MGWCAATATSIVLSWVALLPVLRTASPDDRALSAIDRVPAAATSSPVTPVRSGPKPTTKAPTKKPATTRTPQKPPETQPPSPSVTTENGWTVTIGDDGVRTYIRSFKVEGGQAVIKETPDGTVSLVTATPADGWAVQKVEDTPDNLAVYFNETGHSFIIHATWFNNGPYAEVSEIGQ